MAQLVVAAAGAAIGGATLGTGVVALGLTGPAIGWMVGSLAGSLLFAQKQEGPKIEDGKFSSSIYGQPIPLNYGTMRHATQLAWWSGLIIRTEEVGGKGGGGAEMEKARMNLLMAVCEGPQAAVLRIWANGRLIATFNGVDYDIDSEVMPTGEIRVYLGTDTQVADPTYEAAVGTENAVPYRGTVMVAIDGLEGEFFGNRPPNIECEVASVVEVQGCPDAMLNFTEKTAHVMLTGDGIFGDSAQMAAFDEQEKTLYVMVKDAHEVVGLEQYDVSGSAPILNWRVPLTPLGWSDATLTNICGLVFDPENRQLWMVVGGGWSGNLGQSIAAIYFPDTNTLRPSTASFAGGIVTGGIPEASYGPYSAWNGTEGGNGAILGAVLTITPGVNWPGGQPGGVILDRPGTSVEGYGWAISNTPYNPTSEPADWQWGRLSMGGSITGAPTATSYYVPASDGLINGSWVATLVGRVFYKGTTLGSTSGEVTGGGIDGPSFSELESPKIAHSIRRKRVYVLAGKKIASINIDASTGDPMQYDTPFVSIEAGLGAVGANAGVLVGFTYNEETDKLVVFNIFIRDLKVVHLDPDTLAVTDSCTDVLERYWPAPAGAPSRFSRPYHVGNSRYAVGLAMNDTGYGVAIIQGPGYAAYGGPVTLQEIVEDLSDRSGLPAVNLDASEGTDLVAGFKVARQTSARAAIDSLRPAYFFDMPEIGSEIVLTKRGKASVAAIDSGELGASIFQLTRGDPEPAYELEHVEEREVPRRLEITYVDAGADYDPGVQVAERQVGESAAPLQIEVPVSLTAEQAARIAWVNLMLAHASKNPVKLKLSHGYDALVPSNCIDVPHASGNSLRVRIEEITRARPMIEVDAVLDEQSVYTFEIGGVPRYQGPRQSGIGRIGDTILALMDVPPLREQDDALILYAAMARDDFDASWSGATLYKSVDGGASYDAKVSTSRGATLGTTSGALGNWTGGNVWDNTNTLTVVLTSGTFSSATDLAVLNGANAVAVAAGDDWEIVQFVDATLVAENTWELSRLLRGRKGTERCMDAHASGDRVVLLSEASLRTLEAPSAEIAALRHYKSVTAGQAVADAPSQALTLAGRSVKPLAPVHIEGARDLSNDLTITWMRRARLYDGWDAPLDEPAESYQVDVYDGTSVVRTINASTNTATYTAAQQTADGLTPGGPVTLAVYQISSRVGRGYAGEATV